MYERKSHTDTFGHILSGGQQAISMLNGIGNAWTTAQRFLEFTEEEQAVLSMLTL
jgi:Na+/H+-translocating membrane pyrophosphatase